MKSQGRESPAIGTANGTKRLRVLCAEDDAHVARMLKIALESAGYSVECLADGRQALERITSDLEAFDLLVTDHDMPRLSGLGLVEKLRDTAFSGRIIVHSSELRSADAAAYRAFAVDCILSKPAQIADLLAAIRRIGKV